MKITTIIARSFLGFWYMLGAVDGWIYLLFGIHWLSEPKSQFVAVLVDTTYFWVFMKTIQLVGAVSLLANIRPAFGLALVTPVSAVLCLYYFAESMFREIIFLPIGLLIVGSTGVLIKAYSKSFLPLLAKY